VPHEAAVPFTEVVIPSDLGAVRSVQDRIDRLLDRGRASRRDVLAIQLAVEEALVNAVKHGNQLEHDRKVTVAYRLLPDRFDVVITDEGNGFDPADVPDPTADENLDRPCGRGLLLMRHYMTTVEFPGRGNCVRMSRLFNNNETR
jgi:serine/threonine-protein kinase RsbW